MKIRSVSLLNLNSLRGEHSVDLAGEPFASAGIFAITGPTGSGKSTLLDAITLALYGRAARYGSAPNPADMMSRHCGECRAEVVFEVGGKIYRASWHLHRARSASDGNVQPPKRYVYGPSGEVLTQKIKEADAMVESLCGLDYGRFMRSVLLAQGDFARFLKSAPDQRAAVLESLTGTSIYSDLSTLAHSEHARHEKTLAAREQALGLMRPLEDDERSSKEQESKKAATELTEGRATMKVRTQVLADADALEKTLLEQAKLTAAQTALAARRASADTTLARLAQHHATAPFAASLERAEGATRAVKAHEQVAKQAQAEAAEAESGYLQALAAAVLTSEREIAAAETRLDRSRAAIAEADKSRAEAAAWIDAHKADAALPPTLPELLESLASLSNARQIEAEAELASAKLTAEQKQLALTQQADADAVKTAESELLAATRSLKLATAELQAASAGRTLGDRRTELESIRTLRGKVNDSRAAEKALRDRRAALSSEREKLPTVIAADEAATKALAAHEKQIEALARHLSDARLFASLDEQRADLDDGAPCPLCGAEDHPYCSDDTPPTPLSTIERELAEERAALQKAKAEHDSARSVRTQLETHIKGLEERLEADSKRLEELQTEAHSIATRIGVDESAEDLGKLEQNRSTEIAALEKAESLNLTAKEARDKAEAQLKLRSSEARAAATSLKAIDERLIDDQQARAKRAAHLNALTSKLDAQLLPFNLSAPDAKAESAMRELLRERSAEFVAKEKAHTQADTLIKTAQHEEKTSAGDLKALRGRVAKIRELVGEHKLPAAGDLSFTSLDEAAESVGRLRVETKSSAARADERTRALTELRATSTTAQAELTEALDGSPFADPEALRSARLPEDQANAATQLERELSDQVQQIKGALASAVSSIAKLREKSLPEGDDLTTLRSKHEEAEASNDLLATRSAELLAALRADDELRAKLTATAAELAQDRSQLGIWTKLAALIGSHDGKKFRVFAQGLSLDLLLRHANRHLERLNPRYQLGRAEGEELGLEIVDLFQASARRPMASLSGGESFLASLALALGLSDLAGRKVQIDSLFIDEGFGSLDTETLDTALSALESLRLQDKTVGVISHVEMLKERIGVQIAVERQADGSSHLRVICT